MVYMAYVLQSDVDNDTQTCVRQLMDARRERAMVIKTSVLDGSSARAFQTLIAKSISV